VKVATDVPLTTKLEELKEARSLATDIVESGSKLYSLLGREEELRVGGKWRVVPTHTSSRISASLFPHLLFLCCVG
jgi:hypothetical protein